MDVVPCSLTCFHVRAGSTDTGQKIDAVTCHATFATLQGRSAVAAMWRESGLDWRMFPDATTVDSFLTKNDLTWLQVSCVFLLIFCQYVCVCMCVSVHACVRVRACPRFSPNGLSLLM